MDRVIAPHSFAVERAVRPIKDNVLADKKNTHSHEQRRRSKRPVAVLVESNQSVCGGYSEQKRGADDQHGNAKVASDDWDEKPVAQVRDEIALAPPSRPGLQAQNHVSMVKITANPSEIGILFVSVSLKLTRKASNS